MRLIKRLYGIIIENTCKIDSMHIDYSNDKPVIHIVYTNL